jgi:hypothetical protein
VSPGTQTPWARRSGTSSALRFAATSDYAWLRLSASSPCRSEGVRSGTTGRFTVQGSAAARWLSAGVEPGLMLRSEGRAPVPAGPSATRVHPPLLAVKSHPRLRHPCHRPPSRLSAVVSVARRRLPDPGHRGLLRAHAPGDALERGGPAGRCAGEVISRRCRGFESGWGRQTGLVRRAQRERLGHRVVSPPVAPPLRAHSPAPRRSAARAGRTACASAPLRVARQGADCGRSRL